MKGQGRRARSEARGTPRSVAQSSGVPPRGGPASGSAGGSPGSGGPGGGPGGGGFDSGDTSGDTGGDPEDLFGALTRIAAERGVPRETVEQDFAAGHLLAAISDRPELRPYLVLKGGAALKKLYFDDDYRFSEDLDYSSVGEGRPAGEDLARLMDAVARDAEASLGGRDAGFAVGSERYVEKRAHPGGQEAFVFRFKLPWQRRPTRRLKVEVTLDEVVLASPVSRPLAHGYPGSAETAPGRAPVRSYALEEVVAEKALALISSRDHLRERGWTNGRSARDLYDLHRILGRYGDSVNRPQTAAILRDKADRRGVSFTGADDFLPDDLLQEARVQWKARLSPVVPGGEPPADRVIPRARHFLEEILAAGD